MSQVCQVTGKKPLTGMNISHSHVRTKKRSLPNLRWKRYWVPSENRFVRLRISTAGMRIIDKRGIDSVLAEIRARGERV
jgi:large subunit ribosomal protein L28